MSQPTVIEMAGRACAIRCDRPLTALLTQRYQGFLSEKSPSIVIDVEVVASGAGPASALEIQPGPIATVVQDRRIVLSGPSFDAHYDFSKKEGAIRQPLNLTPLDLLLKIAYADLLMEERAFFIHGCAVARDERGYLFFGPSGSGKSTLARAARWPVLADELVIVQGVRRGDGGAYDVHGTPFWGGMNGRAVLSGLFALPPDRRTAVMTPPTAAMTPVETLRRLLPCMGGFIPTARHQAALFDLAATFAKETRCHEARFSSPSAIRSWFGAAAC